MDLWLWGLGQLLVLIAAAPLVQGLVKKVKALLQGRYGPPVWQPYADLWKYLHKDEVMSDHASWLYRFAPYGVFAATVAAAATVPAGWAPAWLSATGDLVVLVYLLGAARILTALAGMDTGSAFGAMGSSREMFVSSLAEPVLFVTLLATALPMGTTNVTRIADRLAAHNSLWLSPPFYLVLLAFFIVVITETGRIPVDNPDTHLELTMFHEGMLLEYSGPRLGFMLWSAWIKQLVLFTVLIDFTVPWGLGRGPGGALWGLAWYGLKVMGVAIVVAFIEMSYAKIRFFRIPRLLGAALTLSVIAIVAEYLL